MINQIKKIVKKPKSLLFIDYGNYRSTIFLSGTGRSGTTWLQESINYDNSFRIMFEPFHSKKISQMQGWNYRQYLREDNNEKIFLKTARNVLNGNIRHSWIDKFNKKLIVKKRIVKDIRTNLILKWIKYNFPEIPIILLIRHPCAVANSKIKLGWETHLDNFLEQNKLMADFLNPFKCEIKNAKKIFDKHIYLWCIENYIPLKQFKKGEILVIFYENICVNPQKEMECIMSFLGRNIIANKSLNYYKPSKLSRNDSAVITGKNLIESWREDITNSEIKRAIKILKIFNLDKIYDDSNMPLINRQEALNIYS